MVDLLPELHENIVHIGLLHSGVDLRSSSSSVQSDALEKIDILTCNKVRLWLEVLEERVLTEYRPIYFLLQRSHADWDNDFVLKHILSVDIDAAERATLPSVGAGVLRI